MIMSRSSTAKTASIAVLLESLSLISSAYAQDFTNKGLVGYASLAADLLDFNGDTLGGFGSAIAIAPGTFVKNADGSYSGTMVAAPDRGHNTVNPIDYPSRHQYFDFTLRPYNGTVFGGAIGSLDLDYQGGILYKDPGSSNGLTTGLDPSGIRPATGNFPELPIAGSNGAVCIDQEGIAYMADGSYWISDEYGPYIYYVSADGTLLSAIQPVEAVLPYDASGNLNFTSLADPATGRVANQGFEALTVSPDNQNLYVLLQSAAVQDGGSGDFRGKYTRLFRYDIANVYSPQLTGEWVVELATSSSGQARAQSEMYYLSDTLFFVLDRDGDGNGSGDPPTPSNGDLKSKLKNIGYVDISSATNIANTAYDSADTPVAPGGVLNSDVVSTPWTAFIEMADVDQLAKAGLNNGRPQATTIDSKFESIAVASVLDPEYPDDYFVFSFADNDYITANGTMGGVAYQDEYAVGTGIDVPNQVFVYRATLPGITLPDYIYQTVLVPSARARAKARRDDTIRHKKRLAGVY